MTHDRILDASQREARPPPLEFGEWDRLRQQTIGETSSDALGFDLGEAVDHPREPILEGKHETGATVELDASLRHDSDRMHTTISKTTGKTQFEAAGDEVTASRLDVSPRATSDPRDLAFVQQGFDDGRRGALVFGKPSRNRQASRPPHETWSPPFDIDRKPCPVVREAGQ